MVIARSLVQALREAGHAADIIVTPQNRFGRQASAYLATWLTDVGSTRRAADRSGDQPALSELRRAAPESRLLAEPHDARVLRPVASVQRRVSGASGRAKESVRRALIHAADRYLLTRNVRKLFVQSRTIQQRLAIWPELRVDGAVPAARRSGRTASSGWGDYVFMVSRLTPLKRADLLLEALAQPEAAGIRAVIAGEGEERRAARGTRSRDSGSAHRVTLDRPALRRAAARSPRALPGGVLSAARGGLRLRDRRGVRIPQGRWSRAATAAARRSWSRTASAASSASPSPAALAAALARCHDGTASPSAWERRHSRRQRG